MSMFNKNLKIGEGQKHDLTTVSTEGLSAEDMKVAKKKEAKMIEIYKAYAGDNKNLSKLDLAMAMDDFVDMDRDRDGKLSKKELKAGAEHFNEVYGTKVEGKDLKEFVKTVTKATKGDQKESTDGIIHVAAEAERAKAKKEADAEMAKQNAEAAAKIEAEKEAAEAAKAKTQAEEAAKTAELARINTPKDYTVQQGETVTGLLTKSLKGKGIENPTAEQLKEAKEEFAKNNPGALKGAKGKEYLYQGDVVKIAGDLEDKANSDEINANYRAAQAKIKAEAEKKAKVEAEQKAKLEVEKKAKAEAEKKAAEVAEREKLGLNKEHVIVSESTRINTPVRPEVIKMTPKQQQQAEYTKAREAVIDASEKGWFSGEVDVPKLNKAVVSALSTYFKGDTIKLAQYINAQSGGNCKLAGGKILTNSIGGDPGKVTMDFILRMSQTVKNTKEV